MNISAGIVVCGGRSSRMGTDKSRIVYHGREQYKHVAIMLQPHCDKVWLSVNEQQQPLFAEEGYSLLTDDPGYRDAGPMAALLTAGSQLPGQHLLVLGCDYPLLEQEELEAFTRSTGGNTFAAAFYNKEADKYEPLLAYYSAPAVQQLQASAAQYGYSLQKFLRSCDAARFVPQHADSILSVDDPLTALQIQQKIAAGRQ